MHLNHTSRLWQLVIFPIHTINNLFTTKKQNSLLFLFLSLSFLSACDNPRPEPPTIMRDTAMVNDLGQYSNPFVPGHRTTMDGRVGLQVQGGSMSFYLYAPEGLNEPIMSGPSGATILATTDSYWVPYPESLQAVATKFGHHAICDPTEEFMQPGEHTNPFVCGSGGESDCYEFTIIQATSAGQGAQLWGTPAFVEVANPKTVNARIVTVELGEPIAGAVIPFIDDWTEPSVTRDGRLLTGRQGVHPRAWTNPNTGVTTIGSWDLAYSVMPETATPCDVTAWTEFHPISHAPFDPEMIGRYGLAEYQFRDTQGDPIPDGGEVGGTYPWVDRDGANVFMAGVTGRLSDQSQRKYPRRCVVEGCENYQQPHDYDRGFMVGGLWTHGKFVHLDAMINNQDWAVGVRPKSHYWVDLYRDSEGRDIPVRFGAGRFSPNGLDHSPTPPGYSGNANILDSISNLFNYHDNAKPITGRDVVWVMGTGVATDEVVFDDYVDHQAFIVSNMQAPITPLRLPNSFPIFLPIYHNGDLLTPLVGSIDSIVAISDLIPDELLDIPTSLRIQNGATSLGWNVPKFGAVEGNNSRVEPTALGGIKGKGFWLTGNNAISYKIEEQSQNIRDHNWYVSIFIDPRHTSGNPRQLLSFPDNSELYLTENNGVQYRKNGGIVHEIDLPSSTGWTQLALALTDGNHSVTLHYNGYPMDLFNSNSPLFEMLPGNLVIGGNSKEESFRGWIDEFKVLAHDVNPVEACNHAHAQLIEAPKSGAWFDQAQRYPGWAHDEVRIAANGLPDSIYTCYYDYNDDFNAHVANIPEDAVLIRDQINFPEGPLAVGAPRPDSSDNPFCLRCHSQESKGGLALQALEYRPEVDLEYDPRRQPHQPPRRVFGNIPANWIAPGDGPGSPSEPSQAPSDGLLIDPWIMPSK